MLRNLLAAAATLAALSAPAYAVQISGTANGSGTESFSLFGDTSDTVGTLSVEDVNVALPRYTDIESQAIYSFTAEVVPNNIPYGPNEIIDGGTNVPGAKPCGGPCVFSISFVVPAGLDSLTVDWLFGVDNGPDPQASFDLALTVPGVTLEQTPLPAALPLFATGLGALGMIGWRRKRKSRGSLLRAA